MILAIAHSKNNVPIRLTDERWLHIVTAHQEIKNEDFTKIMNVINKPDFVLEGSTKELLAIKKVPRKKVWLVVSYKEVNQEDGFILTAYFSSNLFWLLKKEIVWNKE